jgi:MFS family permease
MLAGSLIAEIGGYTMPFVVGGIVKAYAIPEGWIGFIIAGQIACASLVSIGLAPYLLRLDRRKLAFAGALLVLLGYAGSALSHSADFLVMSRLIGGIGEGILYASIAAVAAETEDADRTFALIWVAVVALAVILFVTLPLLPDWAGPRGIFVALGVVVLALIPMLKNIPPRAGIVDAPTNHKTSSISTHAVTLGLVAALLAILANGYYYFIEGIAQSIGVTEVQAGYAMAISAACALAGPALAHRLGTRFGRTPPLALGYLITGVGAYAVTHAGDQTILTIAMCVSGTAYVFTLPYLLGLAAASGGAPLAAVARGGQGIGSASAPAISGLILLNGGTYQQIGALALGCAIFALLPLIYFGRTSALNSDRARDVK